MDEISPKITYKRTHFLVPLEYFDVIKDLKNEQLGRLFRAMNDYYISGIIKVEEDISVIFSFYLLKFKMNDNHWEKTCDMNKKNGLLGGRPKNNP
jgi:hypothetical protein